MKSNVLLFTMYKYIFIVFFIVNSIFIALSQHKLIFTNNNSVFLYNPDNDSTLLVYKIKKGKLKEGYCIRKIKKVSSTCIMVQLVAINSNNKEYLIRDKQYIDIGNKIVTNIVTDSCSMSLLGKEYVGNIPLFTLHKIGAPFLLLDSLIQKSRIVKNMQFLTHKGNIYKQDTKGLLSIYLEHKKGGSLKFRYFNCGYDYIDIDSKAKKIATCDLSYNKNITIILEICIKTKKRTKLFEIPKSKIRALKYSNDDKFLYFMISSSVDKQYIGNFIFDIKKGKLRKIPTGYYITWL